MNSVPDRPVRCIVIVAGGFWLSGLLPSHAADPVVGPTVTLDPVMVTTTRDYRPLQEGWQMGDVPGFRIFSHGNAAFKTVADQLQLARAAFALVWKNEALVRRPMTVVITADEPEFLAWAQVAPLDMDRTLRVVSTPTGPVLLVNGGHDAVHRAVGRGYVLAQLRDTKLPRWLQEGLAQVVNSAEAEGDHLRIGRVQQDERNQVPLAAIRDVANAVNLSQLPGSSKLEQAENVTNTRGDRVDIKINGMTPTWQELERHLDGELERRLKERDTYTPTGDFLSYLADGVVMDLEKVFDPAARDTVAWRMNAWGFTHYSLFAEKQRYQPQFFKFVGQLERDPTRSSADLFKEVYGVSPGKFELNLSLYAQGASYSIFDFKLAEPFVAAKPAMAPAAESSVLQLQARVFASTERADEARKVLAHGYGNPANRTPSFISRLVELERPHNPARAGELLETAVRREQLDNTGRRLLADWRLERLQQGGAKLQPKELGLVLTPLFEALNQGDQSEELFVLIGRAWAASAIPPKPEHLNALRMGLTYYPKSERLAALLKQLESAS